MNKGRLIVYSGPSGVGKGTIFTISLPIPQIEKALLTEKSEVKE